MASVTAAESQAGYRLRGAAGVILALGSLLIAVAIILTVIALNHTSANTSAIQHLERQTATLRAATGVKGHSVATEVNAVKGELATVKGKVATLETEQHTLNSELVSARRENVVTNDRLGHLYSCTPELQRELNSLQVSGTITSATEWNLYANTSQTISHECSKFLYGETH